MSRRKGPTQRELNTLGGNVTARNRELPRRFPPADMPQPGRNPKKRKRQDG
jgi:hypothetical protein